MTTILDKLQLRSVQKEGGRHKEQRSRKISVIGILRNRYRYFMCCYSVSAFTRVARSWILSAAISICSSIASNYR